MSSLCSKKSTPDLLCCKYKTNYVVRCWEQCTLLIFKSTLYRGKSCSCKYFKRIDVIAKVVYWSLESKYFGTRLRTLGKWKRQGALYAEQQIQLYLGTKQYSLVSFCRRTFMEACLCYGQKSFALVNHTGKIFADMFGSKCNILPGRLPKLLKSTIFT